MKKLGWLPRKMPYGGIDWDWWDRFIYWLVIGMLSFGFGWLCIFLVALLLKAVL